MKNILTPNSSLLTSSRVALPKLFLWNDPTRYQEYPEALAKAEAGRVYSRQEIECELFDITPTLKFKKDGKPRGRGIDGIVNAMGFERFGQRLCVNGLNLIRKTDEGFIITDEGLELGKIYKESRNSDKWLNCLGRHLLLREPRTRLLFGLILKGWTLHVEVFNKFPKKQMSFTSPETFRLDITSKDCIQFNDLLSEYAEFALGPVWVSELSEQGLCLPIEWCGIRVNRPSVSDLSSALKKSFGLLFFIRLLEQTTDGWSVNINTVAQKLGNDVLNSFGVNVTSQHEAESLDKLFLKALNETTDNEGYTIASALANKFGDFCKTPPNEREYELDCFVRKAMYENRLVIESYHSGQPRMGRGLFGDSNYRRVKIEFRS